MDLFIPGFLFIRIVEVGISLLFNMWLSLLMFERVCGGGVFLCCRLVRVIDLFLELFSVVFEGLDEIGVFLMMVFYLLYLLYLLDYFVKIDL